MQHSERGLLYPDYCRRFGCQNITPRSSSSKGACSLCKAVLFPSQNSLTSQGYTKKTQKYRRSSRDMPLLVYRGFINSTYIYRTTDVYLTRQQGIISSNSGLLHYISLHHLANTALSLTAAGISSSATSTFHILPSKPPCPRFRAPPIPAGTSKPSEISRSQAMPATPRLQTRTPPPTASMPAVAECTLCLPIRELYSSYAIAKLTVSVCATMSSRAAAIRSPRSSSDSVDSR